MKPARQAWLDLLLRIVIVVTIGAAVVALLLDYFVTDRRVVTYVAVFGSATGMAATTWLGLRRQRSQRPADCRPPDPPK